MSSSAAPHSRRSSAPRSSAARSSAHRSAASSSPPRRRSRRPRPLRIFLAWLPALLGVFVIILESTQTFSAENTSGPLRALWQSIFGTVPNPQWEQVHHLIRKSGHFLGYGTLSLLFYRAWYRTAEILHRRTYRIENVIYALTCTLLVAGGDEWHQHFLPDRTGTPQDVLLDMTGACILQFVFWLVMFLIGLRTNRSILETV